VVRIPSHSVYCRNSGSKVTGHETRTCSLQGLHIGAHTTQTQQGPALSDRQLKLAIASGSSAVVLLCLLEATRHRLEISATNQQTKQHLFFSSSNGHLTSVLPGCLGILELVFHPIEITLSNATFRLKPDVAAL
jgi:hypothetical protein